MPNEVITDALNVIAAGEDLNTDQAAMALKEIMSGKVSEVQIAGLLMALRLKGESVSEVVGFVRTMREFALAVNLNSDELVDTAGTGGGKSTFNVSTAAAIVAAGAGCKVAKHGNRSATSRSGSADVLEALGANINLSPQAVAQCVEEVGFGFMFAPAHHAATKYVVPVRKELAVSTLFNLLGPLTNPAGAKRQVIGVYDSSYLELLGAALLELGTEHALLVNGAGGIDELSVSGPDDVVEVRGGKLTHYTLEAEGSQITEAECDKIIAGGSPEENALIIRKLLAGEAGPRRELVVNNAAAAIYVSGKSDNLAVGRELANAAIDSGSAVDRLDRYVTLSKELI